MTLEKLIDNESACNLVDKTKGKLTSELNFAGGRLMDGSLVPIRKEVNNDEQSNSAHNLQQTNELEDSRQQIQQDRLQYTANNHKQRSQFQKEWVVAGAVLSEEERLGLHHIRVLFWMNELISSFNTSDAFNMTTASNCCYMLNYLFASASSPLMEILSNHLQVEQLFEVIEERITNDGSTMNLLDCGVLENVVIPILQANTSPYLNHGKIAMKSASMVNRLSWTEDIIIKNRLVAVPNLLRALFAICHEKMTALSSDDAFIAKEFCNIISFLLNDTNISMMLEAGCVDFQVTILQLYLDNNEVVVKLACKAIRNFLFCNSTLSKPPLLQSGALAALIAANERYPGNSDLTNDCSWAIETLLQQ
eukprot:CAMPEP_0170069038 /NCGR_PEP_ID=MMETSP0019_2-20121128/7833_1 /TAXON_ID=98059 /ORGANISM="Dinobryon sp., Strain UTEXLB2267" /LENGTH=363 /DNA_ID=CAMNT_0010276923 /DNA_START=355 /DNA_END=1446 /DNA_ORIENTATION=+